jgi:hypothetical protein
MDTQQFTRTDITATPQQISRVANRKHHRMSIAAAMLRLNDMIESDRRLDKLTDRFWRHPRHVRQRNHHVSDIGQAIQYRCSPGSQRMAHAQRCIVRHHNMRAALSGDSAYRTVGGARYDHHRVNSIGKCRKRMLRDCPPVEQNVQLTPRLSWIETDTCASRE